MLILKRVSSIKHINLQALVPALLVMVVSFGPWISVHAQEMSNGTPTVIEPTSAPVEPAPVAAATEIPSPVETALVPQAPVEPAPAVEEAVPPADVPVAPVEPAPAVEEAVAPTDVPFAPVEPAPAVDEPIEAAVLPTAVPVAPVETPTEAVIIPDAPSDESEDVSADSSGSAPGSETIVTPEKPVPTIVATAPPTPTPTAVPSPTPSPTVVPSPTPEPTPVITWSQPEPVTCTLLDGKPAGLRYDQSRNYRCHASTSVSSNLEMPKDMTIRWNVSVDFNGDAVVLGFPQGSAATISKSVPGNHPGAVSFEITQAWIPDSGIQALDFDLTISRTTCVVGEQMLSVDADPIIVIETTKAEIKVAGVDKDAARFISPVIAADAPTVAFDEPVTFESLSATSVGLDSSSSRGSTTIVITGEWDPCQTWSLNLSGTVDVPAETPAQLRAVSVNNESYPGDACDLQTACDVIVLPTSGNAATPLRFTIGLELQLHALTPVGDFGINLQSELIGVETQP